MFRRLVVKTTTGSMPASTRPLKQEYEVQPQKWNSKHTANLVHIDKPQRNSKSRNDNRVGENEHSEMPSSTAHSGNFCHLNWGANVLGDEQQDQEDTGARAVHVDISWRKMSSRDLTATSLSMARIRARGPRMAQKYEQ